MKKAAFLDRDGVINQKAPEGEYITRWDDFVFLPGVIDAVRLLKQAGFVVIVVTNQRCVAKGLITADELNVLHARMRHKFEESQAIIDGVYYCPHDIEAYCDCRKPRPGLIWDAAREQKIELSVSWMIGDSQSDINAGKRAGCKSALVIPKVLTGTDADICAPSLLDAVHKILESEAIAVV